MTGPGEGHGRRIIRAKAVKDYTDRRQEHIVSVSLRRQEYIVSVGPRGQVSKHGKFKREIEMKEILWVIYWMKQEASVG